MISKNPSLYKASTMIELMIAHPEYTHAQFAGHFGRPPAWFASVLASEVFQEALTPFKDQIADPSLTATMEERFRALAVRSVAVLQDKMNNASVDDSTVLKAAEMGIKALGMRSMAAQTQVLIQVAPVESVAERLLKAMDKRDAERTIDGATSFVLEPKLLVSDDD